MGVLWVYQLPTQIQQPDAPEVRVQGMSGLQCLPALRETYPERYPSEHPTQCMKLKELGQYPEAEQDLSKRADSLQLVVRPFFAAWQKMSLTVL